MTAHESSPPQKSASLHPSNPFLRDSKLQKCARIGGVVESSKLPHWGSFRRTLFLLVILLVGYSYRHLAPNFVTFNRQKF